MTVHDPELLRAIRGGIGGTYGVITQYQYILYPTPQTVWAVFYVPMYVEGQPIGAEMLAFYLQWLQDNKDVLNLGGLFSTHDLNRPNNSIGMTSYD